MGALPFCAVISERIARPIAKYKIIARIRMASSGVTLSHLPHDVLLTILQQGLGPRELCRLEQCSKQFRELVDEQIWRGAFLRRRRANALRDPSSWKQEYARRDLWSRDWRQLIECHCSGSATPSARSALGVSRQVSLHTQKLRRFALKMMAAANPGSPSKGSTSALVVDPNTHGAFATIGAAIARAKPFDTILVMPGEYHEQLRLEKQVELIGVGPTSAAVIIGWDGPAIEAEGKVESRVANLTICQKARVGGGAMTGAVLVKGGAVLIVEECDISSEVGHCVVVQGAGSCGYVLHNAVRDAKGVGVLVCDHGKGVIEDNDILRNGRAGVAILSGGDPLVCQNKIHEGMDSVRFDPASATAIARALAPRGHHILIAGGVHLIIIIL